MCLTYYEYCFIGQLASTRYLIWCSERITKTVAIERKFMEIEEKGVKLRLTIVDTPGYNDCLNANEWCAVKHIHFTAVLVVRTFLSFYVL